MPRRRSSTPEVTDAQDVPRSGTQAIERAVALLRSFDDTPELGITELANRHGLSPSTTHRIARALVEAGLLEQDAATERYRLGIGLAELGALALQHLGIEAVRPLLRDLAERTGEAVNLGVREGHDVLVLLRVPSPQPLRFEQPEGSRVPVHTSAMGKALLAFAADPAHEVELLTGLDRLTARTITSKASLRSELSRTRERGYAVNDEERNLGVRAVGAPVLDDRGLAVAAIAVQGPTVRLTDKRVVELAPIVQVAAKRIAGLMPAR